MKDLIFKAVLEYERLFKGKGHGLGRLLHTQEMFECLFQKLKPKDYIFVQGNKMFINPNDPFFVDHLIRDGVYERFETELLKRELRPGMRFVDIGANIGYYSLIAAGLVKEEGRVYAFEPEPYNFRLLEKNVTANGYANVTCEQLAVSDHNGQLELFLSADNPGDHRTYDSSDGKSSLKIDAIALDDYFADPEKKVDLIKMDIQGSEPAALRGMERLIARSGKVKLFVELWPRGLSDFGSSAREFSEQLHSLGFDLEVIDEARQRLRRVSVDEVDEMCRRECSEYADHFDLLCNKPA